jgi:malic enzyme
VVIHSAGTACIGIADMMREVMIRVGLSEQEATGRFWAVDSRGLLTDDPAALRDFQPPYAHPAASLIRTRRPDHACRCGGGCETDDAERHPPGPALLAEGIVRQMD